MIPQKFHELIQHTDTRTTGVNKRCNALVDTNGIGICKTQCAVRVHVDVCPSGTKIMTGHVDDFRIRSKLARPHKLNLAVSKMDVRDSVDALFGVHNMCPF